MLTYSMAGALIWKLWQSRLNFYVDVNFFAFFSPFFSLLSTIYSWKTTETLLQGILVLYFFLMFVQISSFHRNFSYFLSDCQIFKYITTTGNLEVWQGNNHVAFFTLNKVALGALKLPYMLLYDFF